MARQYVVRSKEEKLSIAKRNLAVEITKGLAREFGCSDRQMRSWVKVYLTKGESGLEVQKKPGNPLPRYERRKDLTYEEQLQYLIESRKRELVKKNTKVWLLKNGANGNGQCH